VGVIKGNYLRFGKAFFKLKPSFPNKGFGGIWKVFLNLRGTLVGIGGFKEGKVFPITSNISAKIKKAIFN